MMFIKDGKILTICRNVPPYKGTVPAEAPLYPDEGNIEVSEVIEVNSGYCSRHGIKDGDSVRFDFAGKSKARHEKEKEPSVTPAPAVK
jgi:uncharacterized membrane protein (UPF0127 family)